jgi:hypothetical protein
MTARLCAAIRHARLVLAVAAPLLVPACCVIARGVA